MKIQLKGEIKLMKAIKDLDTWLMIHDTHIRALQNFLLKETVISLGIKFNREFLLNSSHLQDSTVLKKGN